MSFQYPETLQLSPGVRDIMDQGCNAVRRVMDRLIELRQNPSAECGFGPALSAWLEAASDAGFTVPLLKLARESHLVASETAALLVLYACHTRDDVRDLCATIRHHRVHCYPDGTLLAACVRLGIGLDDDLDLSTFALTSRCVTMRRSVFELDEQPDILLSASVCGRLGINQEMSKDVTLYVTRPLPSPKRTCSSAQCEALAGLCTNFLGYRKATDRFGCLL